MKQMRWLLLVGVLAVCMLSCSDGATGSKAAAPSPEELALLRVDTLKMRAEAGDLVVRLTDDVVSNVIKNMNEQDKSFSHAGIVVIENGRKMVCNINPDDKENTHADTIRYEPLDSFINPQYNLSAALFRYQLTDAEKRVFLNTLDSFKHLQPHFDEQYEYGTNDKLYCSEMIAKALDKASGGRIVCGKIFMPENLVKLFKLYYKKYNYTEERIRTVPFVAIDNLYRVPGCTELMRIPLKYIAGDAGN